METEWPGPLSRDEYRRLKVAPFGDLLPSQQVEIEAELRTHVPPPKWRRYELCQLVSRAWFEWHARRGRNPRRMRVGISKATRRIVAERDGWVCQLCGLPVSEKDLHIDHVQPVSRGGGDGIGNLQTAHAVCNMRKGARTVAR